MKIFIGITEVANFISTYKQGFEKHGFETFTVVADKNKYYSDAFYDVVISEKVKSGSPPDKLALKLIRSLKYRLYCYFLLFKALRSCDVFIYNTGGSLLPGFFDYRIIKLLHKKLVIVFLGSEVRHWFLYEMEMKLYDRGEIVESCVEAYKKQKSSSLDSKLRRIKAAEKYGDLILSQPGHGQLQTRPYMRVNVGINLEKYHFNVSRNKVPLVLHAPSSRGIKGTEFVLEAVERLYSEGLQFEFKLIENMPNSELLELLIESDIVVDELCSDTIGVLSTEAMATGNAVLTSYMIDYARIPSDCPVINVNKMNIYECLRRVIVDDKMRYLLAIDGRSFVEKHHDVLKITNQIISWIKPAQNLEFDFTPNFYKTFSIPKEIIKEERGQARKEASRRFKRYFQRAIKLVF